MTTDTDAFERHRPRLFGLAYRMLSSATEAEDAVQDACLRWIAAGPDTVEHPGAWLTKVVTNLCLTRLTSARARREVYPGPWLPEPVVTSDGALGPLESAERREAVSFALLVLLERLTPAERAVYVLREAFAYSHREIAEVLGLGEANCRQLYRRAATRLAADGARFDAEPEHRTRLVESFLTAAREGDMAALERLLAADVTWWGDGGGKVTAARRPIEGREKVLRFLAGALRGFALDTDFAIEEINGGAALVGRYGGRVAGVLTFEVRGGLVAAVRAVVNPDKLAFAERQLDRG
ncbi:RNA polymerase sigma-70 factor [Streptomyces sp. NPDC052040]|uniref:RNA polymerase sigma-70 factor n=1 Tax=unclassified Streptomyces TaxID=2593676 RepID=UPI0037D75837